MALFADYKCTDSTGVWGVCGRVTRLSAGHYAFDPNGDLVVVGFLVFLMIQATVGTAIVGTMMALISRTSGRMLRFEWSAFCSSFWCYCCCIDYTKYYASEWERKQIPIQKRSGPIEYVNDCFCCNQSGGFVGAVSPGLWYSALVCFAFSAITSAIIIGCWVGRAIAVRGVPICMPYINTSVGLYGCVDAAGGYVPDQQCNLCLGVGFGIFGIPLLLLVVFVIPLFLAIRTCIWNCAAAYSATKRQILEAQRVRAVAAQHQTQPRPVQGPVLEIDPCPVCFDTPASFELLCHHFVCTPCYKRMIQCPICRAPFDQRGTLEI